MITDIDEALLSEEYMFCRYIDDFRIFFKEEMQAYKGLAFLANTLFENHGLTLQQNKTEILSVEDFSKKYLEIGEARERDSLTENFEEILENIGIDDWYEEFEYDELDEDIQREIDALNLTGLLEEQIQSPNGIDLGITRFVLRRLSQINNPDAIDIVLNNIMVLYPVFKDAVEYVTSIRRMESSLRGQIGQRLIDIIEKSIVGHLDYHRCWILHTFTKDREWDNEHRFIKLYNDYPDEFSRRELICAIGRAAQDHWFKTNKRNVMGFSPWERRAFLAAASCLPGDESLHWYRSIYHKLDDLEKVVVDWAKNNQSA